MAGQPAGLEPRNKGHLGWLTIAGFLAMIRKAYAGLLVLASVTGGVLISQTMKWAYARPRPELVPTGRTSSRQAFRPATR